MNMSAGKKFVPIFERFPAHYRRFLEDMKRKPAPVHYKPPAEKYVRHPVTQVILRTEERPIRVVYPRECHEGIWGGEGIVPGYAPDSSGYHVKYFTPQLKRFVVYSEILDKYMRVTVTERTLILINEHCGFDLYILKVIFRFSAILPVFRQLRAAGPHLPKLAVCMSVSRHTAHPLSSYG
ncbi:hypothetical protein HPB51_006307 [Rhipicephalus microplus]|uniref:Uncharacterized protein n=1 Tax=Rhipicephalus microplus TaxID=6941 RepID=A0A9J6EMT3_RHIMP|nr:hypothetical protein HPB51_006307 [Rhipicephalus microplus]